MNRPTRSKLFERRREVANYALKGWTQAAIARQMHIPEATVSRDLAAMREVWREFPVYDFDRARLEPLQKIDLVEADAQKGRFCATRGFVVESGVSPPCTRVFGSSRMVGAAERFLVYQASAATQVRARAGELAKTRRPQ